jgi:predicted metal-binding membrane protein
MIMGLPGFVGLWTVMMAAMMLPSVLPTVLLFATVARSRAQSGFRPAPTALFIIGYLGAWALTGVGAAALDRLAIVTMAMWREIFVGGALILAGAYQLTRWKALCLGHCRTPLHFFMEHWRDGSIGAVLMGGQHGLYCLGCCWGLMLALLALGLMNPAWMGLIALLITIEKIAPHGERVALASGVIAILFGAAIAFGWLALPPTLGGM